MGKRERKLHLEIPQTLELTERYAPDVFDLEQLYRPRYAGLEAKSFGSALGGDGGLIDLWERLILPSARQSVSTSRSGDVSDWMGQGPRFAQAVRASNPQQSRLLDLMGAQAEEELGMGAALDPSMQRLVRQSVRGGQAARGMGMGPTDVFEEAMAMGEFGQNMRNQRRDFARQTIGLNQAVYSDPFERLMSADPVTLRQADSLQTQGTRLSSMAGPRNFDPWQNQYAADAYNATLNARIAKGQAASANRAGLWGGLIQGAGALGAAGIDAFWGRR